MKNATKTTKTKQAAIPAVSAAKRKGKPAVVAAGPAALDTKVSVPAKVEPKADKRITPGAKIETWRVVVSQRKAFPGYWLQGGFYEAQGDRQMFRVAEQQLFATLAEAKQALQVKRPKAA